MSEHGSDKVNPTFPQFTNVGLNEGVFDQLMLAVSVHLDKEYKLNRIKGTDYAKVYVGAINSTMQYATQFLLGTLLINEQQDKLVADISLTAKQEEAIDNQIKLGDLEVVKLTYEIEHLLPLIKAKAEKENLKIDQEILVLIAQVSLIGKQEDKIDKEIEFFTAKILTESANTNAGVAHSDSLIGRQMSLLAAQKLGFAGDIQMKAAKLHADYDAVFQSVQEVPADVLLHPPATDAITDGIATAEAIALL